MESTRPKTTFDNSGDTDIQSHNRSKTWALNKKNESYYVLPSNTDLSKSDTTIFNKDGELRLQRDKNRQMDNPIVHIDYEINEPIVKRDGNENDLNALKVECNQEKMITFQPIHCENVLYVQRGYGGYGLGAAANIFSIRPPDALSDGHGPRNMLHALDLGVIDQTGGNGGPLYPMELDMYADGDDVNQRILEMILFQNYTPSKKAKASVGLLVGVNNDNSRFGSIVQFDGHFDHAGIDLVGAKPNCINDHDELTCPASIYLRSGAKISFSAENDTFQYMNPFNESLTTFVSKRKISEENAKVGVHYYAPLIIDESTKINNDLYVKNLHISKNIESETIYVGSIIVLPSKNIKEIKNIKEPKEGMIINEYDNHVPVVFENGRWYQLKLGSPI